MTTIETPSVIRHLWKSVLALGVLTLVLGAAVLIWPGDSIVVASVVFGVYLLVSGIAQAIAAFTVGMSPGSRVLFFISGALSVVLGYFAFRDFHNGAAVWMLAIWIGVGFIFQGVTATALAIDVPALPARGWYIFVGILTVIAGVVTIVWPISSIVALAIVAGAWLVVVGITEVVWALSARRTVKKGERRIEESLAPSAAADSPRCAEAQWRVSARRTMARKALYANPISAERQDMTTPRAKGIGRIPQLISHRLLRNNQVHHPAVLEEANRRSGTIQLRQ